MAGAVCVLWAAPSRGVTEVTGIGGGVSVVRREGVGYKETMLKVCATTEISVFSLGLQEIPAYQLKLPGRKQKDFFLCIYFRK